MLSIHSDRGFVLFSRKIVMFNIIFLLFLSIISSIGFTHSEDSLLQKGESLYWEAITIFLEHFPPHSASLNLLEESIGFLKEVTDNQTRDYWLAKIAYLMGIIEKDSNNHKKAEEYFVSSKELVSKSMDYGDFSDGYRLLADVEGQIIAYRDLLYMTKYGPSIKNMITKAIELDPDNVMAYLSLAMYYRDAPFIAGGDLKKSKSVLKDMVEVTSNTQIDLFSLYLWIDTAWTNSDNNLKKVSDYVSMLDIFSNQSDIESMVARIERKYLNNN